MRDLAERALDTAAVAGAEYADCRVVDREVQQFAVKNGAVAGAGSSALEGLGVRLVVDGAWGFAGTDRLDPHSIDEAVGRAVAIARAGARTVARRVRLAPTPVIERGEYHTPLEIDPFTVSVERKLEVLFDADAAMGIVPGLMSRTASLEFLRERRYFASSEGTRTDQHFTESGGGLDALASGNGETQVRSYPNSFGRHQVCGGWEAIEQMQLAQNGTRIAEEAVQLLTAPLCPQGRMTLILDATQAALQVHESCGHPIELDRVLGDEAAYAGTSFLTPDLLGSFRYGSEQVTITADATRVPGLGSFGWDDEGVPAQRTMVIDQGRFVGYMSSRETAAEMGGRSSGTMRADGWSRIPLIRMTNVNLEAGESSLEEMIATTEHGVYMDTNRSWSIDDRRLNFQFGTQLGWEIRDGQRVRMVRNPLYAGRTPDFWASCDAVAGADEWRMLGVVNCGKGQPSQVMHVGHGAAPCRFQDVSVRPA